MKHDVHSGNWKVEGVTTDDPRIVCRVARGGIKPQGEEVSLGIGPGVRLEPGFVALTGGSRAVLYVGMDEAVARQVAADFDRRGRHTVPSFVRRQGAKLEGADYATILPEGKFRLEGEGHLLRAVFADDRSDKLLLFAVFEGGGGRGGGVCIHQQDTTCRVLGEARAWAMDGESMAVIALMQIETRLVIELKRDGGHDGRMESDVIVLVYHGSDAQIELTEERMSLHRWLEVANKVTA